jgi:Transglycosylase SLT domain
MILMQKLYYTPPVVSSNRQVPPMRTEMRHVWLVVLLASGLASAQTKPADAPVPDPQGLPGVEPAEQSKPAVQPPAQQPAAPAPAPPSSQKPDPDAVKSAMAESIAKQRIAVIKQVAGVMGKAPTPAASFFTVPWVETPVPFNLPPCDPIPPAELDKLVGEASQLQGVKAELIRAVIAEESGARPCAVSWKGAQGLMQLMPATSDQFGVKNPFDPHQNVEAGTELLKQLLTKYNNDVSLALAAYNAGEVRVDKDGGVPQIRETQTYVNDIQTQLNKK